MIALGLFILPFILFKAVIIPLKILVAVKAISMVNSFLLATLLYKNAVQNQQYQNQIENVLDTNEQPEMVPMDNVLMDAMDFDNLANNENVNTAEENAKRIIKMLQKKYNKW